MVSEDDLGVIQELLVKELRKRLEDGTATTQDLKAAITLLKDNDITVAPKKGTPLVQLGEDIEVYSNTKTTVTDLEQYRKAR